MKGSSVVWKTLDDIFGEEFDVIKDGISPGDIYQGTLGDCYLLSSVSALAENPKRIERLLLTKESNEEGIYSVALNYCGVWKKIYVDSYFPVTGAGKLFGAHNDQAETWVMLLEKAYAKLYSGYWNIGHGGTSYQALKDLTGAPCEYNAIDEKTDTNQLWNHLALCQQNKYVVSTGTVDAFDVENGLNPNHSYTFRGVHNINGEVLVELRNPWGPTQWAGDWGEGSEKWTEPLLEEYQVSGAKESGRFFIPFHDYCKYFDHYDTCYYEDGYVLSSFNDELDNDLIGCYKVEAVGAGNYYVMLSQEDKKAFYNPKFPSGIKK